jgi:hypothetical protein
VPAFPPECPLGSDVDFERLASTYDVTGAEIKQIIIRAATKCALREESKRKLFMADLEASCKDEMDKKKAGDEAWKSMYM